jgi:hypothetical protein
VAGAAGPRGLSVHEQRRRRFTSAEHDSLLPLAEETAHPVGPVAPGSRHDTPANDAFRQNFPLISTSDPRPESSTARRQFLLIWGVVGMLVGVLIATQLNFWQANFDQAWLSFGRLRRCTPTPSSSPSSAT